MPQGTLVARLKAHASGYPAVLTPTGAFTAVERGEIPIRYNPGGMSAGVAVPGSKKQAMEFDGRRFVVEPALAGDVAFVHAWKADEVGNLVFRYSIFMYTVTRLALTRASGTLRTTTMRSWRVTRSSPLSKPRKSCKFHWRVTVTIIVINLLQSRR